MTPKEYLSQIRLLDIKINQRIKELDAYRQTMALPAVSQEERVQTNAGTGPVESAIVRLTEMEDEINRLIDTYVDMKHRIIGEIQGLENRVYMEILFKRYVEYKSIFKISKELKYTYEHMRHLHGRALQSFGQTMKVDTQ